MSNYFGGQCLRVVEQGANGNTHDLAIDFIVYGTLAEIFARDTGVNRGFGGSMHALRSLETTPPATDLRTNSPKCCHAASLGFQPCADNISELRHRQFADVMTILKDCIIRNTDVKCFFNRDDEFDDVSVCRLCATTTAQE